MKFLRKMLIPFALMYGLITWSRNLLYNAGILKSRAYDFPIICVGNLNAGGTGKSPMIEYLLEFLFKEKFVRCMNRFFMFI